MIFCQLIDDDIATACGIAVQSSSPVLALCRKLVALGHDPASPMEAYRDDVLSLTVRSIGEAAALKVNAKGNGFCVATDVRTAPLASLPTEIDLRTVSLSTA